MSILVGPMFSCELRQHDLRHSLLEEVVEHPSVLRAIVVGEVGLHRQVDREKRSRVRRFGDRELVQVTRIVDRRSEHMRNLIRRIQDIRLRR